MRIIYFIVAFFLNGNIFPQTNSEDNKPESRYERDTLIVVHSNEAKDYKHSFLLYIPEGTPRNEKVPLLVEPNNTGFTNDSIEVHLNAAIDLASKSSVGNNVSRMLKIPLLVPVFPRPTSQPLIYTHALDRDAIMEKQNSLERLDLQLISMVVDAKQKLSSLDIITADKILMTGFSASGSFVNRFTFLHPQIIQAVATGGLNSKLMLPLKELGGEELNYPIGINDFDQIAGRTFESEIYKTIPQFIYMGQLDDNDAVKHDDAYSPEERKTIYSVIGEDMQTRWRKSQEIYKNEGVNAQFRTYGEVGHWTTSEMLLEIIKFFQNQR